MILKKLQTIRTILNNLWHEDTYSFNLTILDQSAFLTITHNYANKTGNHPAGLIFSGEVSEQTIDDVMEDIRKKIVARAVSLAETRKDDYEKAQKRLEETGRAMDERLRILEELKLSLRK